MTEIAVTPRSLRIVVPRYGSEVVGGSETLVRRLAHALAGGRGWEVEVWTTTAGDEATWRPRYLAGTERDGPVSVRRFRVVLRRRPAIFHALTRGFFRLPRRLRPETAWIAAQGPYSPHLVRSLSRATAVPTLFTPYLYHPTLRGIPSSPHPRILLPAAHEERPLHLRAVARALATADALWFNTPEEQRLVESVHPIARAHPSAVGATGIEPPAAPDSRRFRDRHGLTGPYLLSGGRVARGKGMEELLVGMRRLRQAHADVRLVLTGEASRLAVGEDGVVGAGWLDEAERWAAIAGATAVVAPSLMESLSLLCLEAWACGRPAVVNAGSPVLQGQATRSGAALTYLGPEAFAEAAARLLSDDHLAARLGVAGSRFVAATYTWDLVARRLSELIEATEDAGGGPAQPGRWPPT